MAEPVDTGTPENRAGNPVDGPIDKMSGAQRTALLLMSIGKESAARVLRHMGPKDVQKVGSAMAALEQVSSDQVGAVVRKFLSSVGKHTALGMDSRQYIQDVLVEAVGKDRAGGIMDRIIQGSASQGIETLKWMDPRVVADMLRNEHPQIMAIVLSNLDADQAGAVLAALPKEMHTDLLVRVATLDLVQPSALEELDLILERQVSGNAAMQTSTVGGVNKAAEILNFVEPEVEAEVMEQIKEADADLGQQIEDLMFVFENLGEADDASIQALLREISTDTLLLALKGVDETMREKFFNNMSKRAAEMLRDDLDAKGPVRLSEVEAAQKEILGIARRMAEEGTISLGSMGGEAYV